MWHRIIPVLVIAFMVYFVWQEVSQGRFGVVPKTLLEIRASTDAQVFVDADLAGTIRAGQVRQFTDLKVGQHTVSLTALGFKTESFKFTVGNTQKLEHTFELEPEIAVVPKVKTVAFGDLEQSIQKAADGDVLFLAAGEYYLLRSIAVGKSISLIGAGQTKTRVVSRAGVAVMSFKNGDLHLKGISFVHSGKRKADVVDIKDSQISIEDCAFSGGYTSDSPANDGDGLWLHGHSSGKISDSRFEGNVLNGLEVRDTSNVRLLRNVFNRNDSVGLSVWETASVQVFDSVMQFNKIFGAQASNESVLKLWRNKLLFNKTGGVYYFKSSSGSLENNRFLSQEIGVAIKEQSNVLVANNSFELHDEAIYIAKKAHATIGKNTFRKNGKDVQYQQ